LASCHDVAGFDCGVVALNHWLATMARRSDEQGVARTHVWTLGDQTRVVAYYSVAPTQLARSELPRSAGGGHSVIPGFLLARLALDRSLQGCGLGRQLLVDALETIAQAASLSGGRVVVADPIDQRAAAFYAAHDFVPTGAGDRLYLKTATLLAVRG
jgi:predicted GNAT family N-acyltransferase